MRSPFGLGVETYYICIITYIMSDSNPSRKKKVVSTNKEKPSGKGKVARRKSPSSTDGASFQLLFQKKNYSWVFIGLGFILLGFLLMLGGEQSSPEVWESEKIYSFRRITLAPFLILVGLGIQIYAIFKK
jgi:hypothetical protein